MKDPILAIPDEVQKNNLLLVGNTGGGKSNTCRSIVEYNLWKGRRTLVIDPTGDWWGIKSDRTGTKAGYPVVIFGGEHADIPIDDTMGARLGELFATTNTPAVIDLQLFSHERRARFLTPFFENLYRLNREVMHLTLDEAHRYLPQRPQSFEAKLLHHVTDIVTGGRSRGFKSMVVTQRPAKLNKDPVAMCKTFILHEITSSHDRKAIKEWVEDGEGMDSDKWKEINGSLPTMPTGEAWVWIPKMKVLERRKFPLAQTFDSGKAPEEGDKKLEPTKLAHVDLDAIRALLAPKAKIAGAKPAKGAATADAISQREHDRIVDGLHRLYKQDAEKAAREHTAALNRVNDAWRKWGADAFKAATHLAIATKGTADIAEHVKDRLFIPPIIADAPASPTFGTSSIGTAAHAAEQHRVTGAIRRRVDAQAASGALRPPVATHDGDVFVPPAEQKVLEAIAWWNNMGRGDPKKAQLCGLTDLSPTASTIGVYVASLKKKGLLTSENGTYGLTDAGRERTAHVEAPASPEDIQTRIKIVLAPAETKVLDTILAAYPEPMSKDALCEATGLSSTASTVGVYLAKLRLYDLVTRGGIRASDWLFQGAQ